MKNILKLTIFIAVLLILTGGLTSCKKTEQLLSDEEVLSILLSDGAVSGNNDPALLIGDWDAVRFAHTDGKTITTIANLSEGDCSFSFRLPIVGNRYNCLDRAYNRVDTADLVGGLTCENGVTYCCTLSGNLISFARGWGTLVDLDWPHIEYDLELALLNAHSFVIRGDELIIYFEGDETCCIDYFKFKEPKNLLFFKKRKS